MSDPDNEQGVITALLERLRTQRLPRALDIKAKVERGEALDTFELNFLDEVFADAQRLQPRWRDHPELGAIIASMIHLYHEITTQALANEQGRGPEA